jgi:hypothetical protein
MTKVTNALSVLLLSLLLLGTALAGHASNSAPDSDSGPGNTHPLIETSTMETDPGGGGGGGEGDPDDYDILPTKRSRDCGSACRMIVELLLWSVRLP